MNRAFVNGVNIAYDLVGYGAPVVLIHGFPLNRRMWRQQLPSPEGPFKRILTLEGFRLLALDLRGHGESDAPEGPYSIDLLADDVAALMRHLNLTSAIIVGHSMGGYIAFRLFARHRRLVRALVLANTRAEADTPEGRGRRYSAIERIRREGPLGFLDELARALLSPQNADGELLDEVKQIIGVTPTHSLIATLQALAERPDSVPLLSEIRIPVLIIAGDADQLISAESVRLMHERIAGSKLVIIKNSGHLSCLENPEDFNDALLDFAVSVA